MHKLALIIGLIIIITATGCKENPNQSNSNLKVQDKETEPSTTKHKGAVHLTKHEFIDKVWDYESSPEKWIYKGSKPCIIDFYADWCGPCKIAAPILEELAIEYNDDIVIYKIDTDQERELAGVFGIRSIPAFLYCPVVGEPQMAAGIGRTPEQTKEMFVNVINEFLLARN